MQTISAVIRVTLLMSILGFSFRICAQSPLERSISLEVNRQRLDQVLEIISNKGNFYFSYNSNSIRRDSLVSFMVREKTVQQVLKQILPDHYEFRESGNYIIIRKMPVRLTFVTSRAVAQEKFYVVRGYVLDDETGAWIPNASIYEKSLLVSTLSNADGFFKLKLKQKNHPASITVSKEFYQDTSFKIDPGYDQQVTVTLVPESSGSVTIIGPEDYFAPEQLKLRVRSSDSSVKEYTYIKSDSVEVEGTGLGRFLLSHQQKMQSLNLRKFFTQRSLQVSLTPGLGTNGRLSPQVINNFSFNVLGGYNGGVNGFELGGLFNIDKKYVQFGQLAGLFNIVGGHMYGLQIGGLNNTVLDTVRGMQITGISNIVRGKLSGFQVGGIYNHVTDTVKGMQVAGVVNFSNRLMKGVQIAGIINYTRHLKGVQIGLVNISDTSDGLSIGLINVVLKGYHKLSFSADEVVNFNASFKTGTKKLYSILGAGFNFQDSAEVFSFGYGLGTEIKMGKLFSVNPEITARHLYLGSWDYANIQGRVHLNLNMNLGKYVSVFAGPVFNAYYSKQDVFFPGYKSRIPKGDYHQYHLGTNVKGWLGWNAGINFF